MSRDATAWTERLLELSDGVYDAGTDPRAVALLLAELAETLGLDSIELVALRSERRETIARSAPAARGRREVDAESIELGGDERLALLLSPRDRASGVRALAEGFGAHLARARALSRALSQVQTRERCALATLDRLAVGIVLLDRGGRLVHANRTAQQLLAEVARLGAPGEMLELATEAAQARFEAFVRQVDESPGATHSALWRLRRDGSTPLELLGVSLPGLDLAGGVGTSALFVSDPSRAASAPAAVLQSLYGLTAAEARLAGELLRGGSLEAIATRLGVRRETVRTHLRHVFAKVGTTRQGDLVRRLLAGAAGMRWE